MQFLNHRDDPTTFCFSPVLSFWRDSWMISCPKANIYQLISACSYDYLLSSVFCAGHKQRADLCLGWAVRTLLPLGQAQARTALPGPAAAAAAWLYRKIWLAALAGKMVDICLLAHPPTNTFRDKKYP